MPTSLIAETSS